jgi:stage III sporulation protein SpoIIIAA
LRPTFTVVRDADTKCFLLLIRGAISIKERLTAATGTAVPFHHVVIQDGAVTGVVLGHAHCGMVTAARWIAKHSVPALAEAIRQHPDYNIKVNYCDVSNFCAVQQFAQLLFVKNSSIPGHYKTSQIQPHQT